MKKLTLTFLNLFFAVLVFAQAIEVTIDDYTAIPSEHFCLQFKVDSFNQIVSSQYTLEWDPMVISFDSLTANGLPQPDGLFVNTGFIGMGQLPVNWFDALGNGNDLPDGSVMYELCFTATGPIGSSTTIIFTSLPVQIEVTSVSSNGMDIGLDHFGGTVTIVEPLTLTDTDITQPDCNNPDIGSIEVEAGGGIVPYTYAWTGPGTFTANTPDIANLSSGTYYLTVTESSNPAIIYLDTFEININLEVPVALIEEAGMITCTDSLVTLNAGNSSQGMSFDFFWLTSNGNIVLNGNTLNPTVNAPGDYQLIITNNENGCSTTATATVIENTALPTVTIANDGHINCIDLVAILDGTGSSSGPEYSSFWTTLDGNVLTGENTNIATVNASGLYELTIVNESNGCENLSSAMVTIDTIHPMADAGMDQVQSCPDDVMALNGNTSSMGNQYEYAWTTTDGNILSGGNTLMPQINASGTYNLEVTNTVNGCSSSDFTMILLDEDLVDAIVGMNQNICEDSMTLNANLPNNNTGIWSTLGSAQFSDITSSSTSVEMLDGGANTLIWTLSTLACPDYSSDTIVLTVEEIPVANQDVFTIPFGDNSTVLNLIANDGVLTVSGFEITLLSNPAVGSLMEIPDNQFSFSYPDSYFGMQEFEYSLCNTFCPDFCDTTNVLVDILDEIRIDPTVSLPNGITPNGDGINDIFVLPILENNPGIYPDNEMLIFNRWGDLIYQAKPYLNDWSGVNNSGKQLPQGTYYYVLRLNLAEGAIIEGDITILK